MPNISFASGGDTDTLDFVAYVAKDRHNVRSCYVLECGGGLAQDVITTIGQAFELRLVLTFAFGSVKRLIEFQIMIQSLFFACLDNFKFFQVQRIPETESQLLSYLNDLPGLFLLWSSHLQATPTYRCDRRGR